MESIPGQEWRHCEDKCGDVSGTIGGQESDYAAVFYRMTASRRVTLPVSRKVEIPDLAP